jgi:hypothetical protein
MEILWATISIAVTVAILGVVAWVFVIAPYVVPKRQP